MKKYLISACLLCAFVMIFGGAALGQGSSSAKSSSAISQVANGAGKVTVVVVGTGSKIVWVTTKFAAKYVAKPLIVGAGKPLLLELAPRVTVFALRLAGKAIKRAVPTAGKLGFAYLKAKLPV